MTPQQTYMQKCPICGRRLQVKTKYLGMTLKCRHCQGLFTARDPSDIWDVEPEDIRVNNVLQRLDDDLEKSGILSRSGIS